ncbi:hypothetical protein BGW39_009256 [Mortierella sp. 14UC]|nr:hypothetical protein BGW39_009256 [Mortierella sp. 14UC]
MPTDTKLSVLIAGAGLGGLMLGALLEKAGIPYCIYERTAVIKPLGAALLVGPGLMPILEQLGIFEEFIALGKPTMECTISREKTQMFTIPYHSQVEYTGYYSYIIPRPMFYDLLLKQIPAHKVLFNKRVLSVEELDDTVKIQTSDGSIYEGDILVGADGAYSAVRQRFYENLKKDGKLPASDQEELPFNSTCLFGQTEVIDYEAVFPEFQKPVVRFYSTMGDSKPYTWSVHATSASTCTWMIIHHLDKASSKAAEEQRFRESENSQWGPGAAQAMIDETRDFPLPFGNKDKTLGYLYDLTPKDRISKVMLEERVFETWHSGRVVLLGDACHKLNPAGTQGAITAMHDAIAIANQLYALRANTRKEIEKAFSEYKAERSEPAIEAYHSSKALAKYSEGGILGAVALFVLGHLPEFLLNFMTKRWVLEAGAVEGLCTCGSVTEY